MGFYFKSQTKITWHLEIKSQLFEELGPVKIGFSANDIEKGHVVRSRRFVGALVNVADK